MLCRVPERCREMQLNRHRTHASTTITTSESSSGREGRGWNIGSKKKKERERRGGLLYQQQKHYIIGCLCGRVGGRVDGGREVLLVAALCLSLCLKSKYNIYDAGSV